MEKEIKNNKTELNVSRCLMCGMFGMSVVVDSISVYDLATEF